MSSSGPRLVDTGRGFTVYHRGRYLYSSVEPLKAVRRRVERASVPERTLVFVPSVGLGYGLEDLVRRLPASSHVLCVEADEELMGFALEQRSVRLPRLQRLTVVRSADPESVAAYLRGRIGVGSFRRLQWLHLSRGYHLAPDVYDEIGGRLEQEIQAYWKNKIILVHLGRLWIRNIIENIPVLCRSEDLRTLRSEHPVCVLGAGPSLEASLPTVRRHRSRLLLLAVDTALPVLSAHGMRPDLVLALEGQVANAKDFIGQDPAGMSLLCDMTACPAVVRLFGDRVFFFCSEFHPLKLLERMSEQRLRPTPVPALGSVGVAALHTALRLTQGPVFLAGLDFSYPGKRTHARGSPFHRHVLGGSGRLCPAEARGFEAIVRRPLLRVEGEAGAPILTDLVLHSYARAAERLLEGQDRVYDLGSAGMVSAATRCRDAAMPDALGPAKSGQKLSVESGAIDQIGRAEQWRRFVQGELDLLERGMELVSPLLRGGPATGAALRLRKAERSVLEALDYLSYSFPDADRADRLDAGFLARVAVSGRRFFRLWRNTLSALSA
jgi:hypothetical protein